MDDPLPQWTYDPSSRRVAVGETEVTLQPREADALEYILARPGQIVTRAELEQRVWGLAPGVRSATVPVTVRKIRQKLGPAGAHVLQTVHGVGWRLRLAPTNTNRHILPRFDTPFFERMDELQAIDERLRSGHLVLTLVGPAGIGKTRLAVHVAERWDRRVHFLAVTEDATTERLLQSLASMAGLAQEDALARYLDGTSALIVVDEAEWSPDAVLGLLQHLAGVKVLLTSRRPLGYPGETLHRVAPWSGEEGRRFFRQRLQHGGTWSDDHLDHLLRTVDGLALGVELLAARPHLMTEDGLKAARPLAEAVQRSWSLLEPDQRRALHRLGAFEGIVSSASAVEVVDSGALEVLRSLHLVQSLEQGWRVLNTVRAFLQQQPGASAAHAAHIHWLHRRARVLADEVFASPRDGLHQLDLLADELVRALGFLGADACDDVLWVLFFQATLHGPATRLASAMQTVQHRFGPRAFTHALAWFLGVPLSAERVAASVSVAEPRLRIRALLVIRFAALPRRVDLDEVCPDDLDHPLDKLLARAMAIPQADDLMRVSSDLLYDAERYPLARMVARAIHARVLTVRGEGIRSEILWTQLLREVVEHDARGLLIFTVSGLADAITRLEPARAVALFTEHGHLSLELGFHDSWVVGRSGLCLFALGAWEDARMFLEHGARSTDPNAAAICQALVLALRVREGQVDAQVAREHAACVSLEGVFHDGTPLHTFVRHVLDPDLADPPATRLFAAWRDTLATA